jgi:tetratricopeptide (TPR) repeat protein
VAYDSLRNFQAALLSYQDAIALLKTKSSKKKPVDKDRFIRYTKALGRVQVMLFQNESARKTIEEGLSANPGEPYLLLLRARVNAEEAAFQKSLDDFNAFLSADSSEINVFYERAVVFRRLGQFLNAVNDLSFIISKYDTASLAFELRAKCNEDIGNYRAALSDFKSFRKIAKPSQKLRSENALKRIEAKLYEKEKESNPPKYIIKSPEVLGDEMSVAKAASFLIIKGSTEDESPLKSISADGVEADFSRDSLNPDFRIVLNVADKEELTLKLTDIYLNVTTKKFRFSRAERQAPELQLFIPVSTTNSEIYHDPSHDPVLRIFGKVNDESLIAQININGFQVNFDTRQLNPEFSFDLKVGAKDSVKISIADEYGNISVFRYAINAKEAAAIRNNPMGRTWLIFIENSDYLDFEKLDGPSKDAGIIKFALADYRFDNIITKRNMTLQALDRFFRIDLRDLVKQQHVNSIMIWFAGHGKFLNGSGYWIPSDARKNDEAGYFPVSNLKGYLENYGPQLRHILIVSDACESGESFRIGNQVAQQDASCSDPKSREPASIVFSSTSSEKASDNSLFAKTFATALQGNSAPCISLAEVAAVVADAVEKNQRQNTRIGLIKGLPNNGGSFLFIKSQSR